MPWMRCTGLAAFPNAAGILRKRAVSIARRWTAFRKPILVSLLPRASANWARVKGIRRNFWKVFRRLRRFVLSMSRRRRNSFQKFRRILFTRAEFAEALGRSE